MENIGCVYFTWVSTRTSVLMILQNLYRMKQGTLDNAVSRRPRVPAFTTQGLLDYIVELVVSDDEVLLNDIHILLRA